MDLALHLIEAIALALQQVQHTHCIICDVAGLIQQLHPFCIPESQNQK